MNEALCLGLVEVNTLHLIWVPALSLAQALVGFIEVCYRFDVYVVPSAAALEVKAGLEFAFIVFIAYGYFVEDADLCAQQLAEADQGVSAFRAVFCCCCALLEGVGHV